MKHLLAAVALLALADVAFRHGQGVQAMLDGVAGIGHAIGGWVFYGAR